MSAQQMEPIDEFAPATDGIEEGWHRVRYQKSFETNGQYGKQNVHILEFIDIEGESIRVYTDPKMSKNSQQRGLLEAFLGREINNDEQVTPRMVKNREAEGFVEMSEKTGKPKVAKFRPAKAQAPAQAETLAAAAPPPPGAPRPPAPPRPTAVRSDEQANKLLELAMGREMDLAAVQSWIAESYAGKALETISPAEATALIDALNVPF